MLALSTACLKNLNINMQLMKENVSNELCPELILYKI